MLRLLCCLMLPVLVTAAQTGPQTSQEIHTATGVVISVDAPEKKVTIKHGEIPGYMSAMTMPFDVKDTNELTGLGPGDPISFRLIVSNNFGWVDQIKKTGPKTNVLMVTDGPFPLQPRSGNR